MFSVYVLMSPCSCICSTVLDRRGERASATRYDTASFLNLLLLLLYKLSLADKVCIEINDTSRNLIFHEADRPSEISSFETCHLILDTHRVKKR